jgi:flagellar biosynthesis protein FlhF
MQIRTFRAKSLQQALQMVRYELGPDAKVLQTRELPTGWWERLSRGRQFEVRARRPVDPRAVPLPLAGRGRRPIPSPHSLATEAPTGSLPLDPLDPHDFRERLLRHVHQEESTTLELSSGAELTAGPSSGRLDSEGPLFDLLTQLLDAEISDQVARALLDLVRSQATVHQLRSLPELQECLRRELESELTTTGPIHVPVGQRRVISLVGPTGVGKTTTIAKLAANLRLRERRRVGLITVDTYRMAAVEQLRAYAEIIDLPMEVVATPREMREAVIRLSEAEIVLVDTAGRSPQDAVQLQELKTMLHESGADEVHLVMSAVGATPHLQRTVERFSPIGTTALLITKLDEVSGLGNVLPVLRSARLPVSYLTCGQSVPDDIVVAETPKLVPVLLGQASLNSLS